CCYSSKYSYYCLFFLLQIKSQHSPSTTRVLEFVDDLCEEINRNTYVIAKICKDYVHYKEWSECLQVAKMQYHGRVKRAGFRKAKGEHLTTSVCERY
uniref:Uncharacterized protein n=1 Tax=Anopheles arabiensis TaxID=7173 RepID=A0A182ICC0_ANOAR